MASKQRSRAPRKAQAPNPLADLGIFDIPDVTMDNEDSDVDESALESELEAILSGKAPSKPARPKKKDSRPLDIERIAAECMKDPNEDEDDDDDDESVLLDPDLLEELQGLSCGTPEEENVSEILPKEEGMHVPTTLSIPKVSSDIISLLEERLCLYNNAVAAAKAVNDTSKVRRYGRAVKTLEDLLKSAKSGRNVNEEDIPPVVNLPKEKIKPQCPETNLPQIDDDIPLADDQKSNDSKINIPQEHLLNPDDETDDCKDLIIRRDQYKYAALQAKRAGDKDSALKFIKMSKGFDAVIEAVKNGEPVDLRNLPPPPSAYQENKIVIPAAVSDIHKKELQETQTSSAIEAAALAAASEPEDPAMFAAPAAPTTVLEALHQRLDKYNETKATAVAEGNTSKVRRLQRIIKSYENAIKDYQAGKNVDFEELPAPPGFAPIPFPSQTSASPTSLNQKNVPTQEDKPNPVLKPQSEVKPPARPNRPAPQLPSKASEPQRPRVQRTNTSTFDKQLEFLLERQKLFRQAAIAAKKNGDIQQAKEYLRMSKGFDSMIEATKCGLPIDASSIPTPPQLESDFVVIDASECIENEEGSPAELMETLDKDLNQQIEICTRNKEHFLRLGDVSSASKFEKLGLESRKDLSVIRHLKKSGGPTLPKFHYETRLFSMVQCHTDLADNDLLVTIERGINLPGKPDDLDSYVKLEFAIPSDAPQRAKTHTIRDTNNPIFQEEFKFEINRKSRAQLRQFKRQALKLEVWSKGGFLRSDTLLGTASVKLLELESKCTIHDCFDLMDGRKAVGGKLEVKLRIRDPLLVKQVEEVREKWLVIGS